MSRFAVFFILLTFYVFPLPVTAEVSAPLPVEITTSPEDTEYLRDIMKGAFRSIYFYRNPVTGLCTDFPENPDPKELQKAEHQFLMLTSIAVAGKIGFISEGQAIKDIDKILTSIEKMKRNRGFFLAVYRPVDCTTDMAYPEYSTADCGWIYCALATVGEIYPQFKKRTDKILKEIDWSVVYKEGFGIYGLLQFYDDGTVKALYPIRDVQVDIRTFTFMVMASGAAPSELWTKMEKHYIERYGVKYMKPGEAMGYGEQPMSMGYYLDERGTDYGMSCANMGWGQINYAQDMEFPSWGWSSCLDMDGYLGWGTDKRKIWSRINTHAAAAQVIYYPNQVVKAFKAMEKLGIRKPVTLQSGKQMDFGLRDSIDVDTGETPEMLLPGLDQNIVFLSLANYLYDGIVWKYFMQNEMVRHGINIIEEYRNPKKEYIEIYKKRDISGPSLPPKKTPHPAELLVDNFSKDINSLDGKRNTISASLKLKKNTVRITFNSMDDRISNFTEELNGANLTDYNALKLMVRGEKQGKVLVTMHLGGEGGYIPVNVKPEWSEIIIPFRSFMLGKEPFQFGNPNPPMRWTAMWHNRSDGEDIGVSPINIETIEIKEISFLSLPKEGIRSAALLLREMPATALEKDGTLDDMETLHDWIKSDNSMKLSSSINIRKGRHNNSIAWSFNIGQNGGWVTLSKDLNLAINKNASIVFNFKAEGGPANLEVKLIDPSGATFLKVIKNIVKDSDWQEIKVKLGELNYGWGGVKKETIGKASKIEFAVTSDGPSAGCAYIDDIKIVEND